MHLTSIRKFAAILPLAGVMALGAAACDQAGADVVSPGDQGTNTNQEPGQQTLGLSFSPGGDTTTACGEAAGVYVEINDGADDNQSCTAMWAPTTVSGQFAGGGAGDHLVADCLFVLTPGLWSIVEVSVIDADGAPMACCSSNFPSLVSVAQEGTTEIGGVLHCDTIGSGGLDIFGAMNRPPYINNVVLSPSKFGQTCQVIQVDALATDPEGDDVAYAWQVLDPPASAGVSLKANGSTMFFASDTTGTYTIRVTASDLPYGDSHHLDFPLHITQQGELCDPAEITAAALAASNAK